MATENLPMGQKFRSQYGRTISEGDFTLLHNLTWINSAIHCDLEYMKSSQHRERILASPCIWAVLIGLGHESAISQSVAKAGFKSLGAVGFDSVRFPTPVKPGDTLWVEQEVIDAQVSDDNPQHVIVKIKARGYNQKEETVCEGIRIIMYEKVTGKQ